MQTLRQQLPGSVDLQLRSDRSVSILASLHDVQFTLFLTLALVVLVIFLFLRNLSATIIPSLALPFSLVGTFAVMYALDYSLDNLSMMALSLAAVFIPVLFMGGIVGRLFHEFAVTIGAAILVSGVVSLTLTPMLCSRFLKPSREAHYGRFYEASERVYERVLHWYERSLEWAMARRPAALAFSAAILVATGALFWAIPKGFLPSEDNSQIFGTTETVEGTSFDDLVRHQQQVMAVLQGDPNVDATMSFLGGGQINQGRVFMQLKPRSQRDMSVDQLIRYFNRKLSDIPGIQVFL